MIEALCYKAGRSRIRFRLSSFHFTVHLNLPAALWPWSGLKLLTEISTKNLPGGKLRPARKTDNLTDICGPIVWKMWEPRRLTTLWASTAGYRNNLPFILSLLVFRLVLNPHDRLLNLFRPSVDKSVCLVCTPETTRERSKVSP
jgi:hypothetical protein